MATRSAKSKSQRGAYLDGQLLIAMPAMGDPRFARNEVHVVASAAVSLDAAAAASVRQGIEAVILSDSIEGEARDVGRLRAIS